VSAGLMNVEEKVETGKRVAIEDHWEAQAASLGGGRNEKFMKLLGARKKPKLT